MLDELKNKINAQEVGFQWFHSSAFSSSKILIESVKKVHEVVKRVNENLQKVREESVKLSKQADHFYEIMRKGVTFLEKRQESQREST